MRLLVLFLTILVFSGSSFAECRNKDCMTAQFELGTMGHTFYYDEVFNIGTNWYIIFDVCAFMLTTGRSTALWGG